MVSAKSTGAGSSTATSSLLASTGGGGGSSIMLGASSSASNSKVDVTMKLAQLQNLCKRDPVGYREDYEAQIRRLESECSILKLSPQSSPSPRLIELIQFAAAVSSSVAYRGEESDRIANLLIDLLVGGGTGGKSSSSDEMTANAGSLQIAMPTMALQLHRDVRKTCVSALILMRNKGVIPPLRLLELFFKLLSVVADKGLRELLYKHMVNDIRNINKKGKRDDLVNRSIQSYLHRVISTHGQSETAKGDEEESATDIATKRATDLVCELYRRQVWTDSRTVAILASAVTAKNTTVMARAMRFFLNIEEKMAEDAKAADEEIWDASQKVDFHRFSRKTNSRQRHVDRQLKNRKKQQKKREGTGSDDWMDVRDDEGVDAAKKLYPAIELLRDPQGLAEAVLRRLKTPKSISYKVKLLMMNFVTRLVGNHELLLLNLYPFLQKYMGGQQRDVTAVLAYTVQACHESVPPDEVCGILKTIAHNFVTERCSEEQMAVGINAIRAICSRVPSILSLEETRGVVAIGGDATSATIMDVEAFVRDIAGYNNHRDRSVAIAGKAFVNFIRETYPSLLQGKDRGLKGSALHRNKTMPMRFGEQKVSSGVEGADLLVEYESKRAAYMKKKERGELESDSGDLEEIEDPVDDNDDSEQGEEEDEEAPDLVMLDGEDDGNQEVDDEENDNDDEEEEEVEEEEELDEEELDNDDDDEVEVGEVDETQNSTTADNDGNGNDEDDDDVEKPVIDLSKMSQQERDALKQHVSSTRVFSSQDFAKMRKLVERERRARMDPREAARRKRAIAQRGGGEDFYFDPLSDDDDDDAAPNNGGDGGNDDDDDQIKIKGAVGVSDIMAEATRKRQTKADKLQKVLAGREKFETKGRAGGSTNTEKLRRKNFVMSKSSRAARAKGRGKGGLSENNKKRGRGGISNQGQQGKQQVGHEARKRRRKL